MSPQLFNFPYLPQELQALSLLRTNIETTFKFLRVTKSLRFYAKNFGPFYKKRLDTISLRKASTEEVSLEIFERRDVRVFEKQTICLGYFRSRAHFYIGWRVEIPRKCLENYKYGFEILANFLKENESIRRFKTANFGVNLQFARDWDFRRFRLNLHFVDTFLNSSVSIEDFHEFKTLFEYIHPKVTGEFAIDFDPTFSCTELEFAYMTAKMKLMIEHLRILRINNPFRGFWAIFGGNRVKRVHLSRFVKEETDPCKLEIRNLLCNGIPTRNPGECLFAICDFRNQSDLMGFVMETIERNEAFVRVEDAVIEKEVVARFSRCYSTATHYQNFKLNKPKIFENRAKNFKILFDSQVEGLYPYFFLFLSSEGS